MTRSRIETSLQLQATFDAEGKPFVDLVVRFSRGEGGWIEINPASAIAHLERECSDEEVIADVASKIAMLRMAAADVLLKRREGK